MVRTRLCAGTLLLLARTSALRPLGWPARQLPRVTLRVAGGCTGLATARSPSCTALVHHTLARFQRTPGAVGRVPSPRLCAGVPARPPGVMSRWRRLAGDVAKTMSHALRLLFMLLPYWLLRRLPARLQPRSTDVTGAADATDQPQPPSSDADEVAKSSLKPPPLPPPPAPMPPPAPATTTDQAASNAPTTTSAATTASASAAERGTGLTAVVPPLQTGAAAATTTASSVEWQNVCMLKAASWLRRSLLP